MRVTGSRVVITGAGSGIGRATALGCARSGAGDVACVDIDGDAAGAASDACLGAGGHASAWTCDVADAGAVWQLADAIESERRPVDIIVTNAGVGVGGPFLRTTVEDWDWLMGVNLSGVAYGCHAFGARMDVV